MDIRDYMQLVRRRWRLILAAVLVFTALGALVTVLTPRQYEARAQLYVSTAGAGSVTDLAQGGNFTQRQVATYADLVTSPLVLQPVIDQLSLGESTTELAAQVAANVPPDTVLIDVLVSDEDANRSALIANTVSVQFADTIDELESVGDSSGSAVKATVVRQALVPTDPSWPRPLLNIGLGLLLGLLVGLSVALLRHLFDTGIANESDVARVTDRTVIGGIAFDKQAGSQPLIVRSNPQSTRAEAFRTLRTNLRFIDAAERPRSMVFTSSLPGEGKTTTVANLALTMAASGATVCVIEGDLRRPRLLDYMGLISSVGLTNVLIGQAELDDVLQPYAESLTVLGCGPIPPNPSELLGSNAMSELVRELESRFDHVIIDAPPLLPVTDAAVLSRVADGTIVVVGAGVVNRDQLSKALASLDNVDANVLGLVMNRLPLRASDAYSYYYNSDEVKARLGQEPAEQRARRKNVPVS